MGMANAGIIEAVAAGCSVVHTAFNGLGDRTGNAATEEVAVMLELGHGVSTGLTLDGIMNVSLMVENIAQGVPANKPMLAVACSISGPASMPTCTESSKCWFDITIQASTSHGGQEPVKLVLGKNIGTAVVENFLDR
jgi:hypothetical protein